MRPTIDGKEPPRYKIRDERAGYERHRDLAVLNGVTPVWDGVYLPPPQILRRAEK